MDTSPLIMAMMAWLLLLTIGMVGMAVVGLRTRAVLRETYSALQERTADVALQERMNDLLAKLDRYDLARHNELRAAVERFVQQCEADPVTRERMWNNLNDLKHRLKP